jgi:hypothetical protein
MVKFTLKEDLLGARSGALSLPESVVFRDAHLLGRAAQLVAMVTLHEALKVSRYPTSIETIDALGTL